MRRAIRLSLIKTSSVLFAAATFILTVIGLAWFSYRADRIARWTAAKDFYQQCQAIFVRRILSEHGESRADWQKSSNRSDPECDSLSNKRLSPPPYSSNDFYTSKVKRALAAANVPLRYLARRDIGTGLYFRLRSIQLFTPVSFACILFALGGLYLLFGRNGRWNSHASRHALISKERKSGLRRQHDLRSDDNIEDKLTETETASSSIVSRSGTSQLEPSATNLRKRNGTKPQSLQGMQNRVLSHNSKGQFDQAALVQAKVVAEMKRVKGPEHPKTLDSMTKLTYIYRHQGQYQEARELQEEIVRIFKKNLGKDHPSVLDHMIILSDTCQQIFHLHTVNKSMDGDVNTSSIRLRRHHTITLKDMEYFSDFFIVKGESRLAHQWLDSHFSLCVSLYGRTDRRTIVSMCRLCKTLQESDDLYVPGNELRKQGFTAGSQDDIIEEFVSYVGASTTFWADGLMEPSSAVALSRIVIDLEVQFGDFYCFRSRDGRIELWSLLWNFLLLMSNRSEANPTWKEDHMAQAYEEGFVKEANALLSFWLMDPAHYSMRSRARYSKFQRLIGPDLLTRAISTSRWDVGSRDEVRNHLEMDETFPPGHVLPNADSFHISVSGGSAQWKRNLGSETGHNGNLDGQQQAHPPASLQLESSVSAFDGPTAGLMNFGEADQIRTGKDEINLLNTRLKNLEFKMALIDVEKSLVSQQLNVLTSRDEPQPDKVKGFSRSWEIPPNNTLDSIPRTRRQRAVISALHQQIPTKIKAHRILGTAKTNSNLLEKLDKCDSELRISEVWSENPNGKSQWKISTEQLDGGHGEAALAAISSL